MHLRRQVIDQKGESIIHWFGINNVIVVKDKDEVVGDGGDFIDQSRKNRFDWRRLRGFKRSQNSCSISSNSFDFALVNRLQSRATEINRRVLLGRSRLRPATAGDRVARNRPAIR